MQTCPCNLHPLTPHFYIVKLGLTVVYIFSSPEPKAHRVAYSIYRHPASVRRPSTFSNDISSETVRPILFILHI